MIHNNNNNDNNNKKKRRNKTSDSKDNNSDNNSTAEPARLLVHALRRGGLRAVQLTISAIIMPLLATRYTQLHDIHGHYLLALSAIVLLPLGSTSNCPSYAAGAYARRHSPTRSGGRGDRLRGQYW